MRPACTRCEADQRLLPWRDLCINVMHQYLHSQSRKRCATHSSLAFNGSGVVICARVRVEYVRYGIANQSECASDHITRLRISRSMSDLARTR